MKTLHIAAALILLATAGCATRTVVVTDPDGTGRPLTSKIEAQDIRATVEKMAESLISDPGVLDVTHGERPVLDIEPMQNRSQMIVDMRSITDSIRMRLIRSRLFRFVDRSTAGADRPLLQVLHDAQGPAFRRDRLGGRKGDPQGLQQVRVLNDGT